jgi:putative transposase
MLPIFFYHNGAQSLAHKGFRRIVTPPAGRENCRLSLAGVTVIKDCANRYFLSFVVDIEPVNISAKNQSIGIDLGVLTFAFMSDGTKAESPTYIKFDRKVRKLQRKL